MPTGAVSRSDHLATLAAIALRETRLFRWVSWRLVADFVEGVGTTQLVGEDGLEIGSGSEDDEIQLLAVLDGRVEIHQPGAVVPVMPGVYYADDDVFSAVADPTRVRLRPDPSETAAVFYVQKKHWELVGSSWTLARTLDLDGAPDFVRDSLRQIVDGVGHEFSWVALDPGLLSVEGRPADDELRAQVGHVLGQLIVAGVARSASGRTFGLFFFDGAAEDLYEEWRDGTLAATGPADADFVRNLISDADPTGRPIRIYACRPLLPLEFPEAVGHALDRRPDRVVFVSGEGGFDVPGDLIRILEADPLAREVAPAWSLFRSIVKVTVTADRGREPDVARRASPPAPPFVGADGARRTVADDLRRSLGGLWAGAVRALERRDFFRTEPFQRERGVPESVLRRVERDAVVLDIDLEHILQLRFARPSNPPPFATWLFEMEPRARRSAASVGRSLAGNRVGIAVSGGGASAFRIAPFLELIEGPNYEIEVDTFAGVSGGALIGAYYCALGTEGIQHLMSQAPSLRWIVPTLTMTTWPLEAWIDADLGGLRIEDLSGPRYVPVTTELAGAAPPLAVYVTAGTLGEAVRASGTLPPLFGPTVKNGKRYSDGASAALVPLEVLEDVDVIVGCDAVPGPAHSNPWYDVQPVDLAYRYTLLGRMIDNWIWTAFMLQNASFFARAGASVYLDFSREKFALLESIGWGRAADIVAEARNDPRVKAAADDLLLAMNNVVPT